MYRALWNYCGVPKSSLPFAYDNLTPVKTLRKLAARLLKILIIACPHKLAYIRKIESRFASAHLTQYTIERIQQPKQNGECIQILEIPVFQAPRDYKTSHLSFLYSDSS